MKLINHTTTYCQHIKSPQCKNWTY